MCVDSFYVLSAMLLSFLWLKHMKKTKGKDILKWQFWANYYIHRYIRLTPVYMVILGLDVCLFRYIADGPMWNQNGHEPNYCARSWWTNLLYVNNFFILDELCMSWTWYLANDMQFYVFAPIILVLLWKFEVIGVIAVVSLTLLSGVLKAVILMQHANWPPVSIFTVNPDQFDIVDIYWNTLYVKPYIRCKPYLVGMLLGYILYKRGLNVKLPAWGVIIGWICAFASGIGVVFGLYDYTKTGEMTDAGRAIYGMLGRTLWAAALAWLIFACTTGYGGPINALLSWKVWVPFSRITYSAYLVHPLVILGFYSSRYHPLHFGGHTQMMGYQFSNVILGYAAAFILSIMFEVPVLGLEQIAVKPKRKQEEAIDQEQMEMAVGKEVYESGTTENTELAEKSCIDTPGTSGTITPKVSTIQGIS